jgi:hypothetical protein
MANVEELLCGPSGPASWPTAAVPATGVSIAAVLRWLVEEQSVVHVAKAAATLPESTTQTLFTVSTGNVELISLVGEVTTVVQTQANATKLTYNPTGTGASTDLCATLDITADAVGTFYSITGIFTDPLQSGIWIASGLMYPLVLGPGTIELDCAATNTGATQWFALYRAIESGASMA